MKLRNQLLTLSLATLLVPWFGWKLVQELERFLRAGQESALLASARTVSRALPAQYQSGLMFGRERILHLRILDAQPHLDGYFDDWPQVGKLTEFRSPDNKLQLAIMAGRAGNQLYLFCVVSDATPVRGAQPREFEDAQSAASDGLLLSLRSARGLVSFRIQPAAPGPLLINSLSEGGGQLEGFWLERPGGYQVELSLPLSSALVDLSIGAVDAEIIANRRVVAREAGTLDAGLPATWLSLAAELAELKSWLSSVIPRGSRAWVIDTAAWVVADSGSTSPPQGRELSFVERLIYRAVAGSRTELLAARPQQMVRFDEEMVNTALSGKHAQHWSQDTDSALVRNSVAVPIELEGRIRGAVVMEASTDGMLLVTNRALGRLLLSTLLLTFGLAAGLWFFATRLSRRVQRLSGAVSEAMDDAAHPRNLPLTGDRDELGELARNNARLLRAVSEYTHYLQKLAGRLSHELKTPLAITRSSLDNLVNQDLDEASRRYVQRAREGLDRQSAIVRAMSEASRLEAAVKVADWLEVDLVTVIGHCVESYRSIHPDREIKFIHSAAHCTWRCAPDLIAQALDKLVENALSMTGADDEVAVRLDCSPEECRIAVRNSGTRLPDVLPEQLFDSLVSLREQGGGRHLGLGLHIVRLVAQAHGGRVGAKNMPAEGGVEFEIILPVRKSS